MSAYEESPAPEGHDVNGRFTKGNAGGPGNPYARQVAHLRGLFMKRVTDDRLGRIADRLIELPEADAAAARLVLQYMLGRPVKNPHPDRTDADELGAFRANAIKGDLRPDFAAVPLETVLEVMRATNAGLAESLWDQFVDAFGPGGEADRRAAAAVNKRGQTGQPAPADAAPGHTAAAAETTRPVTPPEAAAPQPQRRAANKCRP